MLLTRASSEGDLGVILLLLKGVGFSFPVLESKLSFLKRLWGYGGVCVCVKSSEHWRRW